MCVLVVLSPSTASLAQDGAAQLTASYIRARPVEPTPPRYPSRAARAGREGWVLLSFIVSESGEVLEPMIEDSSGYEEFERSALTTVQEWDWEPALANGEPTSQSMTRYRIVFKLQDGGGGARRDFIRRYREVLNLIAEGALDEAEPLLTDLQFDERHNLYEDAWLWWLRYAYLDAVGSTDRQEKRQALVRALGYEDDYLPPDVFLVAAQELYVLEVDRQDYSGALQTYERLQESRSAKRADKYDEVMAALTPSFEQIKAAVSGDQLLALPGRIGKNSYWVHDLLRRSFSVADVTGRIENVDVRCRQGNQIFSFVTEEDIWNIPESWGRCGLYLKGEPGTTFTLMEYPLEE